MAQIKPNGLRLATQNLARQGLAVFCPLQQASRRIRGQIRSVTKPVFPGYLFVSLAPAGGEMRAASYTRGVARLVTLDESGPKAVPDALIEELQARCTPEGILGPPEADQLDVGDRVWVTDGPLAGQVSRIIALAPEARIWLLLDLMGRQTRVAVKREAVRRD
ncbi:transcriptional antitermination protein, putative [Oceanicola granulosus HTCC2516]|uniref:Transcriptional antitermination protein, putative n=1 Tax=Oceanicola granulosus (strain ATCC BAA-861 / DSM 15982 / KCTC 12143 / HTCC2516) TaxID=314256 RepID=Q2CAE9_OCEGH|nr:transcriptional antitermination protein, putative [Oceanicola granulosus HTCC2516]